MTCIPLVEVRSPIVVSVPSLMESVAAGDRQAFADLYEQFAVRVYRIVHGVIRDPTQAEEVTQEVFLAIWRRAGYFDPTKGTVAAYIGMLAHSKAVERVRSSQASRTRDDNYRLNNIDRTEHHDPVSEGALLNAEHLQIRRALTGLTEYQRQAIQLHYFDRRSYIEVGELLGVSVTAVKARVRGGVAQLRCILAQQQ